MRSTISHIIRENGNGFERIAGFFLSLFETQCVVSIHLAAGKGQRRLDGALVTG